MRSRINNPANQLRWVVFLLAVAVILPTVCLLWFMSQAVKNERLAIRQKLIDSYTSRAQDIFFKNPENFINDQNNFSAYVIYDKNDKILYPVYSNQRIISPSQAVQNVWKLEFSDANCIKVMKEYEIISKISSIPNDVYECQIGIIRCLITQGKIDDAVKICLELAYPGKHIINEYTPEKVIRARLMLVNLYNKAGHKDLLRELQNQLSDIGAKLPVSTETQIFILEELIKLAQKSGLAEKLKPEIEKAQKIIDSASLSVMAADYITTDTALQSQQEKNFFKIQSQPPLYGVYLKTDDQKLLRLLTEEKITQFWQKSVDDFTDKLVFCRIYDNIGQQIAGEPKYYRGREVIFGEVFSTLNLKNYFTGWKVELYLRIGVFREAANRQKFIYLWVAAAVISLMLVSTFLAGKATLKQAKLNKLKNDFIATITHELKTPLSSMRVLVDTLLDGRYEDQKQATDYLGLISKENERLSHLIDNFLTFSRMERNKQAFDFVQVNPAEIAKTAADAVSTKFNRENCRFTVTIDDNLPSISADRDAMVTVLVNLLDNAYKYSYDNKEIELKVYEENNLVCFSVKDNGIGMNRKVVKKIFNKFYQADSSLSRQAQGTGLGLSIVKFIVNAHKGRVTVESKPGKGSTFIVQVPISV
jgi:signal transduction histidine kinase